MTELHARLKKLQAAVEEAESAFAADPSSGEKFAAAIKAKEALVAGEYAILQENAAQLRRMQEQWEAACAKVERQLAELERKFMNTLQGPMERRKKHTA